MEHCEFAYGSDAPSLLSPIAGLGWILALIELFIILALIARGASSKDKTPADDALTWKYTTILFFAAAATKVDLDGVMGARGTLLKVIAQVLGGATILYNGLAHEVEKLVAAGGDPKGPGTHGSDHAANDAHAHAHDGHGHEATALKNDDGGAKVIVNVVSQPAPAEKPHHPHPAAEPPKSLKVLLGDVREALSDFHTYWSDRTARISELKMVRDSLSQRGTLDEDLAKKLDATRALPRSRLG